MSLTELRPGRISNFPWVGLFYPEEKEALRVINNKIAEFERTRPDLVNKNADIPQAGEGEVVD